MVRMTSALGNNPCHVAYDAILQTKEVFIQCPAFTNFQFLYWFFIRLTLDTFLPWICTLSSDSLLTALSESISKAKSPAGCWKALGIYQIISSRKTVITRSPSFPMIRGCKITLFLTGVFSFIIGPTHCSASVCITLQQPSLSWAPHRTKNTKGCKSLPTFLPAKALFSSPSLIQLSITTKSVWVQLILRSTFLQIKIS